MHENQHMVLFCLPRNIAKQDSSNCSLTVTSDDVPRYHVDFGSVYVVAPSPLAQVRTCVSGQVCYFDGIAGQGFNGNDAVLVLDTCGNPTTVPRFSYSGLSEYGYGDGRTGPYSQPARLSDFMVFC